MSFNDIYRSKTKKIAHLMMICIAVLAVVSFPVVKSMNGFRTETDDVMYSEEVIDEIVAEPEPEIIEEHIEPEVPPEPEPELEQKIEPEPYVDNVSELAPTPRRISEEDNNEGINEPENTSGFYNNELQTFGLLAEEDEDVPNSVALLRAAEQCEALSSSEFDDSMTVTSGTTLSAINSWIAGLGSGEYLLTFAENYILTGRIVVNSKNLTIQGTTGSEVVSRGPALMIDMIYSNNSTIVLSNIIFDGGDTASPVTGSIFANEGSNSVLYVENCIELRNNNSSYEGGAIYSLAGEIIIDGGSIHHNSASWGGGILTENLITMNGGEISNNTSVSGGGGIYANSVIMDGGKISNNSAPFGGGVFTENSVTMNDGEISNNTVSSNGGGIYGYTEVTTITISGDALIYSNIASTSGGGVYTYGSESKLIISENAFIHSNTATSYGGGICASGPVDISGGVIGGEGKENTSQSAGGGVFIGSDSLVMTGGEISYNTTNNGGGIYGGINSTITISENALIYSNSATSAGGGVYGGSGSEITISDNAFIHSNSAGTSGGGISGAGSVNIYGGVIGGASDKANTAVRDGGGVNGSAISQTFTMTGGEVSFNIASASYATSSNGGGINYSFVNSVVNISGDAIIHSNIADDYGGGVYVGGSSTLNISGNVLIHSNSAGASGGGISSAALTSLYGGVIGGEEGKGNTAQIGGGMYLGGTSQTFTMTGGEISYNTATTTQYTSGGGIYSSSATINISGGVISNNSGQWGGGMANGGVSSETNISGNALIHSNTAITSGGGVYSNGAINITGGIIGGSEDEGNTASYGGGVYGGSNSIVDISDGEISYNSGQFGGGVRANNELDISGGEIFNNTASTSGGGVHGYDNSTINLSGNASIYSNVAILGGGVNGGLSSSITISDDTLIYSNTASSYGGGIYSTGSIDISGGVIGGAEGEGKGNIASYGGGVYISGTSNLLSITGGEISYNTATSVGGGICNSYGATTISNSEISYNTATSMGGGVYILGDTSKVTISDNTSIHSNAATTGGGIYSHNGVINMYGGIIGGAEEKGNTATTGGGIYVLGVGSLFSMTGGEISYNSATNGGGVSGNTDSAINISNDAKIHHNTATSVGGGIWSASISTNVNISGGEISYNSAPNGGGIRADSVLKILGGEVSSNTATMGGGISSIGGTISMEGGVIGGEERKGNTATSGGGVYITNSNNNGSFSMTGGEISYNNATSGGGINGGANSIIDISSDAKIYYNVASLSGGGITGNSISISGGEISNNSATLAEGVRIYSNGVLNLSNKPVIGLDDEDNGVYLAGPEKITVIGDLDPTSRINIEAVETDTDTTLIANKVDNETNMTPINAFQAEAELFVYQPGLTSDPTVSVLPSTTTYILTDPLYIDLEITGEDNIDITPTFSSADGVVSSIKQTASFTTNITTGVTLSVSIDESTSDLVNLTDGNYTVSSVEANLNESSELGANTWGFALEDRTLEANNSNSTTTWARLPNQIDDSPIVIKTTSKANRLESNNTDVFFGAKVNANLVAGYYQTTLIYTVVGNF